MTPDETNTLAASDLLERAMQAGSETAAIILIGAARRLDSTIDTETARRRWTENWLIQERAKRTDPA